MTCPSPTKSGDFGVSYEMRVGWVRRSSIHIGCVSVVCVCFDTTCTSDWGTKKNLSDVTLSKTIK